MSDPHVDWEAVLDYLDTRVRDMEHYVARVGSGEETVDDAVIDGLTAWTEPSGIGELPDSLVSRAQDVLHRQNELMIRLAEAAESVRHELSQLQGHSARPTRHGDSTPKFVDVAG